MTIDEGKVLICDDSILARKQIKDIIAIAGAPTIFEASDGEKAIEIYKEHKPDLVFLDIVMPKKDGNITINEIMAFDPDAKIIIVSSVGTHTQLKCALEAGAMDFIQKPINKVQIIDALNKYLGR
ncbi:MAG: response regulator [Agathobacter sp.]|nr:response regulator [Agathobacter sp.]MBQ3030326.1 response regulator [Agathobacter sp.]MBQ6812948.1 response regulator [Agathobacter sp.]